MRRGEVLRKRKGKSREKGSGISCFIKDIDCNGMSKGKGKRKKKSLICMVVLSEKNVLVLLKQFWVNFSFFFFRICIPQHLDEEFKYIGHSLKKPKIP